MRLAGDKLRGRMWIECSVKLGAAQVVGLRSGEAGEGSRRGGCVWLAGCLTGVGMACSWLSLSHQNKGPAMAARWSSAMEQSKRAVRL